MEELELALLNKLKGLTDSGDLSWYFTGETSKVCVAFYRDARLKLYATKLEISDRDGDTAVLDLLVSDILEIEFKALLQSARKSAGHYPTGELKAVNKNQTEIYRRLLQD
jgi:hypothetical protein